MVEPGGEFIVPGTTSRLDSKQPDLHKLPAARGGGLGIKGIRMLLATCGAVLYVLKDTGALTFATTYVMMHPRWAGFVATLNIRGSEAANDGASMELGRELARKLAVPKL